MEVDEWRKEINADEQTQIPRVCEDQNSVQMAGRRQKVSSQSCDYGVIVLALAMPSKSTINTKFRRPCSAVNRDLNCDDRGFGVVNVRNVDGDVPRIVSPYFSNNGTRSMNVHGRKIEDVNVGIDYCDVAHVISPDFCKKGYDFMRKGDANDDQKRKKRVTKSEEQCGEMGGKHQNNNSCMGCQSPVSLGFDIELENMAELEECSGKVTAKLADSDLHEVFYPRDCTSQINVNGVSIVTDMEKNCESHTKLEDATSPRSSNARRKSTKCRRLDKANDDQFSHSDIMLHGSTIKASKKRNKKTSFEYSAVEGRKEDGVSNASSSRQAFATLNVSPYFQKSVNEETEDGRDELNCKLRSKRKPDKVALKPLDEVFSKYAYKGKTLNGCGEDVDKDGSDIEMTGKLNGKKKQRTTLTRADSDLHEVFYPRDCTSQINVNGVSIVTDMEKNCESQTKLEEATSPRSSNARRKSTKCRRLDKANDDQFSHSDIMLHGSTIKASKKRNKKTSFEYSAVEGRKEDGVSNASSSRQAFATLNVSPYFQKSVNEETEDGRDELNCKLRSKRKPDKVALKPLDEVFSKYAYKGKTLNGCGEDVDKDGSDIEMTGKLNGKKKQRTTLTRADSDLHEVFYPRDCTSQINVNGVSIVTDMEKNCESQTKLEEATSPRSSNARRKSTKCRRLDKANDDQFSHSDIMLHGSTIKASKKRNKKTSFEYSAVEGRKEDGVSNASSSRQAFATLNVSPYFQKSVNEETEDGRDELNCKNRSKRKPVKVALKPLDEVFSKYAYKGKTLNGCGEDVDKDGSDIEMTGKSNGKKKQRTTLTRAEKFIDAYKRKAPDNTWKPPYSHHHLLQEDHAHDPWRVLVICMFLNRTSGPQVDKVLCSFFKTCPNAEAALKTPEYVIKQRIEKLGFHVKRPPLIQRFSKEYLSSDWTHVTQLPGVGKYAADAYALFCTGKWDMITPVDHKLTDYWQFLRKQFSGGKEFGKVK